MISSDACPLSLSLSLTVSLGLYCTLTYTHRSSTRTYKQRLLDHIATVPQIMQKFLSPSQIVAGKNGVPLKTVRIDAYVCLFPTPFSPFSFSPFLRQDDLHFLPSVQSQNLLRASKGCTSREREREGEEGVICIFLRNGGARRKGGREKEEAQRANTQKRGGKERSPFFSCIFPHSNVGSLCISPL
jgi:hypothetical protein